MIEAHPDSGPIVVDFDIATTAGAGAGVVGAMDGEGGSGIGLIAVHETLSSTGCLPPELVPVTPITVGPVDGQVGRIERPDVPTIHASVTLTLG